jgi:hypothetical protein
MDHGDTILACGARKAKWAHVASIEPRGDVRPSAVRQTPDRGYVIVGETRTAAFASVLSDWWVLRIGTAGWRVGAAVIG